MDHHSDPSMPLTPSPTKGRGDLNVSVTLSVWKPLSHPVDEFALGVCDGTTVRPEDLVETDSIRQGSISTHYYARYHEGQRWYFLHRQRPDEALIFKHVDSKPGVEAPCKEPISNAKPTQFVLTPTDALHSSLKHHCVADDAKSRRSIEVRALVFSGEFQGIDI